MNMTYLRSLNRSIIVIKHVDGCETWRAITQGSQRVTNQHYLGFAFFLTSCNLCLHTLQQHYCNFSYTYAAINCKIFKELNSRRLSKHVMLWISTQFWCSRLIRVSTQSNMQNNQNNQNNRANNLIDWLIVPPILSGCPIWHLDDIIYMKRSLI